MPVSSIEEIYIVFVYQTTATFEGRYLWLRHLRTDSGECGPILTFSLGLNLGYFGLGLQLDNFLGYLG